MFHMPGPLLVGIGTVVGTLAGVLGSLWWARRAARQRRRIPKHWPLDPRRMANSADCQVWHWLNRVFFDHHVMIQAPVTRFTKPGDLPALSEIRSEFLGDKAFMPASKGTDPAISAAQQELRAAVVRMRRR